MLEKFYNYCVILLLFFYNTVHADIVDVNDVAYTGVITKYFSKNSQVFGTNGLKNCRGYATLSVEFAENLEKYLKPGFIVYFFPGTEKINDSVVGVYVDKIENEASGEIQCTDIQDRISYNKSMVMIPLDLQTLRDALLDDCDLVVEVNRQYDKYGNVLCDSMAKIQLQRGGKTVLTNVQKGQLVESVNNISVPNDQKITDEMGKIFALRLITHLNSVSYVYSKFFPNQSMISPSIQPEWLDIFNFFQQMIGNPLLKQTMFGRMELITTMILSDRVFVSMEPKDRISHYKQIIVGSVILAIKTLMDERIKISDLARALKMDLEYVLASEEYVLNALKFRTYISEEEYKEYNTILRYNRDKPLETLLFETTTSSLPIAKPSAAINVLTDDEEPFTIELDDIVLNPNICAPEQISDWFKYIDEDEKSSAIENYDYGVSPNTRALEQANDRLKYTNEYV
ncbi:MAG: cyclin [Holosporaceae bacterium]|jgi:hypothetical protein|nr:cyclin [Holosporaceae bacterium]